MRRSNSLKFPALFNDVTCTALAPGGSGVAHVNVGGERRALFIFGAAPGDRLRIRVENDGRPLRGTIESIEAPGHDRRASPCNLAGRCGGCDWMHLAPTSRPTHYVDVLRSAWREGMPFPNVVFQEATSRLAMRTHARLGIVSRGGSATVAFHGMRSRDLVPAKHCLALAPALEGARIAIERMLHGSRGSGELVLSLGRVGRADERQAVAHLRFSGTLAREAFTHFEQSVGAGGILQGIAIVEEGASRPAVIGDVTAELRAFDDLPLAVPVAGFQQASEAGNRALVQHISEVIAALASHHREAPRFPVVELYAGAGNLSVAIAPHARTLITVENAAEATALARHNLSSRHLNAKILTADASMFEWERGTRVIVLDPPRDGAASVMVRIAQSPVEYVIYVACDPVSFARDAATLHSAGYQLERLDQFELFPETSHAELVALFRRGRS
jgi:23S rRNA (uracil1939-C5)-methyltransferase